MKPLDAFYKKLKIDNESDLVTIEDLLDFFRFEKYMHGDKTQQEQFRATFLDKDNRTIFADILASQIAGLIDNKSLKDAGYGQKIMELYNRILLKENYKKEKLKVIIEDTKAEKIVIIVFGCQNLKLLKQRVITSVNAAIEILNVAKRNQELLLIFTGGNPKGRVAKKIPNESKEMKEIFSYLMKSKGYSKFENILFPHLTDNISKDTVSNLESSFRLLEENAIKNRLTFVLVSSTFHILRIREEFEKLLLNGAYGFSGRTEEVILLGAEDFLKKPPYDSEVYKRLSFELYRYILPDIFK